MSLYENMKMPFFKDRKRGGALVFWSVNKRERDGDDLMTYEIWNGQYFN